MGLIPSALHLYIYIIYIYNRWLLLVGTVTNVIQSLQDYQVRPDLDFLTYLCWRRAIRREHDTMTSIISELSLAGIQPNLKLFSILAMGCNSASKCLSFLSEMEVWVLRYSCFIETFHVDGRIDILSAVSNVPWHFHLQEHADLYEEYQLWAAYNHHWQHGQLSTDTWLTDGQNTEFLAQSW